MQRLVKVSLVVGIPAALAVAFVLRSRAAFPSENTPEGAYARIAIAIATGRTRECFAYLETRAQWASYTIHDYRSKAAKLVSASYPETEQASLLAPYRREAEGPDGADVWLALAESRGWVARLRKDLSGMKNVDVGGERATIETARGTRYTFRRRENGIWGLTLFTAELVAEAEKASRDAGMIDKAAADYVRAKKADDQSVSRTSNQALQNP